MTDKELEDYLKGGSPLSELYRDGAKAVPPAAVDAAILAEAGKAVRGQSPGGFNPFGSSWFVPASLAAVLVLAVGLILYMGGQGVIPPGGDRLATPGETPMPGKLDAGKRHQKDFAAKADKNTKGKAAPAPVKSRNILKKQSKVSDKKDKSKRAAEIRSNFPGAARRMGRNKAAAPAPVPAGRRDTKPAGTPKYYRTRSLTPGASKAEDSSRDSARTKLQRSATHARQWLARIRVLRQAGKHTEADKELMAFMKRYPEYPVPGDLRGSGKK